MESNTKHVMAVFSLMLGLSLGVPYLVSEVEERNTDWLMLAIFFLVLALVFWLWIMREQQSAEEEAGDALDAAEETLKKLEDKAAAQSATGPEPEPEVEAAAPEPEPVAEVEAVAPAPEPVAKVKATPAPAPKAATSSEPDDLTRVEGIGPKYAEILNAAGVNTFAQIAAMSENEIVDLIKSNGGRKSKSMGTWAEQAKLAAAGDWDGLAKLQDELNGGSR